MRLHPFFLIGEVLGIGITDVKKGGLGAVAIAVLSI